MMKSKRSSSAKATATSSRKRRRATTGSTAAAGASIQRLNHDSSFILTVGRLRLAIDPWLVGAEIDGSALFNSAQHVKACASPSDLGHLDAILLSLPFSDHTHEETLALLSPDIPIYAQREAALRVKRDPRLKSRTVYVLSSDETLRFPGSNVVFRSIPTSGILDFTHGGLMIETDTERYLYAPHGLLLNGPTASCLDLEKTSNKRLVALMITCSSYRVPLILGGTVNLGLEAACEVALALKPEFLIDIHSERKIAHGLIPLVSPSSYHTSREIARYLKKRGVGSELISLSSISSSHPLL